MPSLTKDSGIHRQNFDLVIIGLGPAGVACGLQACRDGLRVLAIGDEIVGGLVRAARRLDNLPALPGVSGEQLAEGMARQLESCGLLVVRDSVLGAARVDLGFEIQLRSSQKLFSRTICLATGTVPRAWAHQPFGELAYRDVRLLPRSLSGIQVVVVGGGEAALDSALTVRDRGGKVQVLAKGSWVRATPALKEEALQAGISIHLNTVVKKVSGSAGNWLLECENNNFIKANILMACIGRVPRDELINQLVSVGYEPSVIQNKCPGLFLAGDLINGKDRYVATAMGLGQQAAIAAADYLLFHPECSSTRSTVKG